MAVQTGYKAVIADGSLFIRTILTSMLKSLSFEIVATCQERQALVDSCSALKPDVVLLDLLLADTNNFAPVRAIVIDNSQAAIILMVPEQMNIPEVIVAAVRAGVSGYVRKPISPSELRTHLERLLRLLKE